MEATHTIAPTTLVRLKQALVLGMSLWAVLYLRDADAFGLLDSVDLPIHETGHLVFAPFGEFMGFLGGTLLQLLLPLAFVAHFARRGDRFSAYVVMGWVAQNLWNIARYIRDARAGELPLVGGGEHDWAYLLGRMNLLALDVAIADAVRMVGIALFACSMILAFDHARDDPAAAPEPT
jgi:hypothetical protein